MLLTKRQSHSHTSKDVLPPPRAVTGRGGQTLERGYPTSCCERSLVSGSFKGIRIRQAFRRAEYSKRSLMRHALHF